MRIDAEDISNRDELLREAASRARKYAAGIGQRQVAPSEEDVGNLRKFRERFPLSPGDPKKVFEMLDDLGSPATLATTGGRYFGFVIGGALPASLAASWLASAWDQNAALRVMSPVAAELEEVALSWVCEALGLPMNSEGGLVTCATTANFTALVAARHSLLARIGWNVEDDGLFGAPPIDVVVGDEVHASLLKALSLAGFGKKRLTRVEVDDQGRMRVDRLPRFNDRTIVCIQAGNVNTGAFDPAAEICARARAGRVGPCRRCLRLVGRRFTQVLPSDPWIPAGRLVGDRRSQMAKRQLRLRHRAGEGRSGIAFRYDVDGGLPRGRRTPGTDVPYA